MSTGPRATGARWRMGKGGCALICEHELHGRARLAVVAGHGKVYPGRELHPRAEVVPVPCARAAREQGTRARAGPATHSVRDRVFAHLPSALAPSSGVHARRDGGAGHGLTLHVREERDVHQDLSPSPPALSLQREGAAHPRCLLLLVTASTGSSFSHFCSLVSKSHWHAPAAGPRFKLISSGSRLCCQCQLSHWHGAVMNLERKAAANSAALTSRRHDCHMSLHRTDAAAGSPPCRRRSRHARPPKAASVVKCPALPLAGNCSSKWQSGWLFIYKQSSS